MQSCTTKCLCYVDQSTATALRPRDAVVTSSSQHPGQEGPLHSHTSLRVPLISAAPPPLARWFAARMAPDQHPFSRTVLVAAVAISVAGTSAAIFGGQALRRLARTRRLKRSVGRDIDLQEHQPGSGPTLRRESTETSTIAEQNWRDDGKPKEWAPGEYDEGLIREQVREAAGIGVLGADALIVSISSPGTTPSSGKMQ